jgi:hypothetical protein
MLVVVAHHLLPRLLESRDMLRPTRVVMIVALILLVYTGFFATPVGSRVEGAFDPDVLAHREAAVWRAEGAGEDFSVYFAMVLQMREQERYTWFRAAQAGFYSARALMTFDGVHSHYEQVLPDLEDAATIERDWMITPMNPADVARAELNWWMSRRSRDFHTVDAVSSLMADAYGARYHMDADRLRAAATLRTQALLQWDESRSDPDWTSIERRLAEAYKALKNVLQRERQRAAGGSAG